MLSSGTSDQSFPVLVASTATSWLSKLWERITPRPHPVVIWHGLGDSAGSEGMQDLKSSLEQAFPGIYVHLVSFGDVSADRKAGFFGDLNDQVSSVCREVKQISELRGGYDAIGFSQGGQFLRAVVERCDGPAVRNLVTFGSQHQGVADLPACASTDFICRLAEQALRPGVYTDYAQTHIISAGYFRDPRDESSFEKYVEKSLFLADINAEQGEPQEAYKKRLQRLENFVMIKFDQDVTVVPRDSSWFSSYPTPEDRIAQSGSSSSAADAPETIPLRESAIYKEDRIGLRKIDRRKGLIFEECHGAHMRIDEQCSAKVFGRYIGTPQLLGPGILRDTVQRTGLGGDPAAAMVMALVAFWLVLGSTRIALSLARRRQRVLVGREDVKASNGEV